MMGLNIVNNPILPFSLCRYLGIYKIRILSFFKTVYHRHNKLWTKWERVLNMGRSVELYSCDYKMLLDNVKKIAKEEASLAESLLLKFGSVVGDRYILLHNDFWEDSDPSNIYTLLDKLFLTGDRDTVDTWDLFERSDKKELISSVEIDDIVYELEQSGHLTEGEWYEYE